MPGPVPKRDAERRRANARVVPTTSVDLEQLEDSDVEGTLPFLIKQPVVVPSIPRQSEDDDDKGGWHPIATELWDSFSRSGQALFWEPSDWAIAKLICESLNRDLKPQFVGSTNPAEGQSSEPIYEKIPLKGASLSAYLKAFGQLMLTEGERRRLSIELERTRLKDAVGGAGNAPVVKITDRRQAALMAASIKAKGA